MNIRSSVNVKLDLILKAIICMTAAYFLLKSILVVRAFDISGCSIGIYLNIPFFVFSNISLYLFILVNQIAYYSSLIQFVLLANLRLFGFKQVFQC